MGTKLAEIDDSFWAIQHGTAFAFWRSPSCVVLADERFAGLRSEEGEAQASVSLTKIASQSVTLFFLF